jgi:type I restriction enzyme M protein
MAIKKSELYSSIWQSCDELRGGMDASQYKDYVLVLLFIKYISDKYADQPYPEIIIPKGSCFIDMVALKGKSDIGDQINKNIVAPLVKANKLSDFPDFNDASKLGSGKEMVDRLTNLIAIFENPALDFSKNRAEDDDILGDAYEYLMRHFATESGKSKGQFYTPAEVSRVIARIIGICEDRTSHETTVYDPTCGSGSLLLKVSDVAQTNVTIYGQEKDGATSGLARMNMILHDNAGALIVQGNTLTDPKFKDGPMLKTFDYVVANPPFSDKRWKTGLDPLNDDHERFKPFGVPPAKQGDYAYLLHIVRSLKSTGKGACILPHGVLFRGNAEAEIRRNLVRKGYIKDIIGLPANLFYGTGIPACIVVVDKENAHSRKGIFMIDASKGFMKDGPKNRLRERDIHKIVDIFNKQIEIPKYSRMVAFGEIETNEYNLNIPRYIDSTEPEDLQSIEGHLNGGIPSADVEALKRYWEICPGLQGALFNDNRPGFVDLAVEKAAIRSTINDHPEFITFTDSMKEHSQQWEEKHSSELKRLTTGIKPKTIISQISEDILAHYTNQPLIDPYDIYQHLMDYWAESMQDDCYFIATDGWNARTYRIIEKNKKGKEIDKGWICDLVPKSLIVAKYFDKEQAAIEKLNFNLDAVSLRLADIEEEHGGDEGTLSKVNNKTEAKEAYDEAIETVWDKIQTSTYRTYTNKISFIENNTKRMAELKEENQIQALRNSKGNITLGNINKRIKETTDKYEMKLLNGYLEIDQKLKETKKENKELLENALNIINSKIDDETKNEDFTDLRIIKMYLEFNDEINVLKKEIKEADADLDKKAYNRYPTLTEDEIKTLVVDDKWLAVLEARTRGEMDRITQTLTRRVKELAKRYGTPMPEIENEVSELEAKVNSHLERMGFSWE